MVPLLAGATGGRGGSLSQTPGGSFVPNCLRYETVRGCWAMYRLICEALEASRADLGQYRAWAPSPVHIYGNARQARTWLAPVCRSGSSTQRLKTLVPRRRPESCFESGLPWIAVVRPIELLRRAVPRSCRWLCQQSDHAGLGHAGTPRFSCRGVRRCSTWNRGEPTLQARRPGLGLRRVGRRITRISSS